MHTYTPVHQTPTRWCYINNASMYYCDIYIHVYTCASVTRAMGGPLATPCCDLPQSSTWWVTNEPCHPDEWVMSQIFTYHTALWCSAVFHLLVLNQTCHIYEWVMSHVWMRHVTHIKTPCCDLPQSSASRVTHESYHTYAWVMSRTWMSHVTHIKMIPQSSTCRVMSIEWLWFVGSIKL